MTLCSGSAAQVCGDFDDWTIGEEPTLPAGWSVSRSPESSVTVTSEQAYSGTQSIKVVSAGGGYNRGFLTLDLSETAPLQREMFGRMMIYVTDDNAHAGDFTFLQAQGSTPKADSLAPEGTTITYSGRIDQSHEHIFTHYDTLIDTNADTESEWVTDCEKHPPFTDDMAPPPQYILPKNEWVCVQWHMQERTDHLDFHLNGSGLEATQVNDGKADGSCENAENQGGIWYAPQQFERLHIGVEQYSEDALPRTVYIDNVLVDSKYVNCTDPLTDQHEHEPGQEAEHEHEPEQAAEHDHGSEPAAEQEAEHEHEH